MGKARLAALCIIVACLTGCASEGGFGRAMGTYFVHRGRDFIDIFEVGVEAGPGVRVDARYGLGIFGLGTGAVWCARLGQRSPAGNSQCFEFAPLPFPIGVPVALICAPIIAGPPESPMYEITYADAERMFWGMADDTWVAAPNCIEERRGCTACFVYEGPARKAFPVGAEVVLGVGARARIYPLEIAKFILGIFTIEIFPNQEEMNHPSAPVPAPPQRP